MEGLGTHPAVTAGGYFIALLTVIFTALTNRKKSKIDESALVLGKWKELVDAHEDRIKAIDEAFKSYRTQATEEISALRSRVTELETILRDERELRAQQVMARDHEIAGLKAAIRQNSQSAAVFLSSERDVRDTAPTSTEKVNKNNPKPGEKP